jgi:hypothetical protein
LTNLDAYLEAMDAKRASSVSLELTRVRENGKVECRQKLKEAHALIKTSLESELCALGEKRDELLNHLAKMGHDLATQEKKLNALRGSELQTLRNRIENENTLAELSALQSSLAQKQDSESEIQEKQEVSVMREFNVCDICSHKRNLSSLEYEKKMMSNVKVQLNMLEKFIKGGKNI